MKKGVKFVKKKKSSSLKTLMIKVIIKLNAIAITLVNRDVLHIIYVI